MGIFDFIKAAGAKLGLGGDKPPTTDQLMAELGKHGLEAKDIKLQVEGDTVKVDGAAVDQATKEKIVLTLGNVEGIAKVEDNITATAGQAATFYTVKTGDTLSKIAKQHYGDASTYNKIFEANKPMLTHPDKIYPGQVLRIPPAA